MASSSENGQSSPRKTPIPHPLPDCKPPPRPELTENQKAKYEALLTKVKAIETVQCSVGASSSSSSKDKDKSKDKSKDKNEAGTDGPADKSGPLTDSERCWLSRDCLVRYLRATKWTVDDAHRRLLSTLAWRREYGLEGFKAEYISPEQETGKELLLGYDLQGRPCHYLTPNRQNTDASPRQIHHLFYMVERVVELMPPGVEALSLLINFKPSKKRENTSVGISVAREVLHILQNHYPERLGKALIINGKSLSSLSSLSFSILIVLFGLYFPSSFSPPYSLHTLIHSHTPTHLYFLAYHLNHKTPSTHTHTHAYTPNS